MMLNRIIIYINIMLFMFALIIALLNKLNYYAYIYTISLWPKTNHLFDMIIFAFFCTIVIGIIDLTAIITYAVKNIKNLAKDTMAIAQVKKNTSIKKIIIWIFMLAVSMLTIYIYLDNYIMTMI